MLSYSWPQDRPFLARLEQHLSAYGQSMLGGTPVRVAETFARLKRGMLTPRAFLDRAADTDPGFAPLEAWAAEGISLILNPPAERRGAWKNSNLHCEFIPAGVHTPYMYVVPSWSRKPPLDVLPDLAPLGESFAIKPDSGGGGWGMPLASAERIAAALAARVAQAA